GRFVEPGADGAAPVVEPERRIGQERQAARVAVELCGLRIPADDLQGDRRRGDVGEHAAAPQGAFKVSLNQWSPSAFHVLLECRPRNWPLPFLDTERGPSDAKERVAHG